MSAVINQPLLNFRPMVEEDLGQILDIETISYTFPWSETIFQDCLRVGYCCWVLESDGFISGYSVMSVAVNESHILNICMHPSVRGQGYGRIMLDHLLDLARKHNADIAFLEVRPSNAIAKQLYLAANFNEVGIRRNYYPAQFGREDAVIMACSLV